GAPCNRLEVVDEDPANPPSRHTPQQRISLAFGPEPHAPVLSESPGPAKEPPPIELGFPDDVLHDGTMAEETAISGVRDSPREVGFAAHDVLSCCWTDGIVETKAVPEQVGPDRHVPSTDHPWVVTALLQVLRMHTERNLKIYTLDDPPWRRTRPGRDD